jgi:GNAT superfamily N-acetyltransferase
MAVRPATLADAERIAEIHVAAWRAGYQQLMPKAYLDSLDVQGRAARWRNSLNEVRTQIALVAVDERNEPMGFCLFGLCRDYDLRTTPTGEVFALNVLPSQWSCGYGRSLLDATMLDARRIGWSVLKLWVLSGNHRARSFYEKYGFTADGAQKTDTQLTSQPLHQVRYTIAVA